MSSKGYYQNPANRSCFELCTSCFRCSKRFERTGTPCHGCSGRPDFDGIKDPHPDDYCECKVGVLRWVTKAGQVIIRRFESDPFKGSVQTDAESQDEKDWNSYISEKREELNDPHWDPIKIVDQEQKRKSLENRGWA